MDRFRASGVKTIAACGLIGTSIAALELWGALSGGMGLPALAWIGVLLLGLPATLFCFAVALGGALCIARDVREKQGS